MTQPSEFLPASFPVVVWSSVDYASTLLVCKALTGRSFPYTKSLSKRTQERGDILPSAKNASAVDNDKFILMEVLFSLFAIIKNLNLMVNGKWCVYNLTDI